MENLVILFINNFHIENIKLSILSYFVKKIHADKIYLTFDQAKSCLTPILMPANKKCAIINEIIRYGVNDILINISNKEINKVVERLCRINSIRYSVDETIMTDILNNFCTNVLIIFIMNLDFNCYYDFLTHIQTKLFNKGLINKNGVEMKMYNIINDFIIINNIIPLLTNDLPENEKQCFAILNENQDYVIIDLIIPEIIFNDGTVKNCVITKLEIQDFFLLECIVTYRKREILYKTYLSDLNYDITNTSTEFYSRGIKVLLRKKVDEIKIVVLNESEVICPICIIPYSNKHRVAKMLPCQHNICSICIKKINNEQRNNHYKEYLYKEFKARCCICRVYYDPSLISNNRMIYNAISA